MTPAVYRFVVRPLASSDPRSHSLLMDAHALGLTAITNITCYDLYFLKGDLTPAQAERLGKALLHDPITQTIECTPIETPLPILTDTWRIETALRPGVTDPVAEQIVRAAHAIGITGLQEACTGQAYLVQGHTLTPQDLQDLAERLLANPVIQQYTLDAQHGITPVFPIPAQATNKTTLLPIRNLNDEELLQLSKQRRAALDLNEMRAIQAYFQQQGREMTDIEFECIAQTWSEHCVHKTFRAHIRQQNPDGTSSEFNNLLKTFLRSATEAIAAPWVHSAFVDNAGIIAYDGIHELSFKVETHNHPSAIEPFGGANTGVGGVIRDVIGVSARPIAATDVLCFGPQDLTLQELPQGVLHPRRIQSGVIAGVQDYGNKMGIPTVSGAILYHPSYTANPLVFCGCVGIAPVGSHPRQPNPGDRIIVLGGRTGRDGLRGATFSSMTMDAQTGEVSGASVQIGNPITEKGVLDVILQARDERLYTAITDCGAGGLSSAIGEMSSTCGADVELQHVRLKYPGLEPWEIWLSEAQERMVLAVPPQHLPRLQAICNLLNVECTDLGSFCDTGRLIVRYAGQPVLDLQNDFLHNGLPQRHLTAIKPEGKNGVNTPAHPHPQPLSPGQMLHALLQMPNIASKASTIRIYDHEVQGGTVLKPLTGLHNDGPSDACVLRPLETQGPFALALGAGINPNYGKLDPYRMAISVIDEAVRNVVAVGADPQQIAILDNFCWGDPLRPETLGELIAACQGCYDAALHYRTPFISGKDSLNNEYLGSDGQRHAIVPTLLISSLGILRDVAHTTSLDLKAPGNRLYLIGDFRPHYGGSAVLELTAPPPDADYSVPDLPPRAPQLYATLHQAIANGLICACHDLSEGGLAVAAAEMCIAGRLGLRLHWPGEPLELFAETNGCLLVEVHADHCDDFEALFADLPIQSLGQVTQQPILSFAGQLEESVEALFRSWNGENRA